MSTTAGAFRRAIAADAATGVMASYNLVNGRPTHVDPRPERPASARGPTRRSTTSATPGVPHAVTQSQHYFDDEDEAYAAMLKAGLDRFTVDDSDPEPMIATLQDALAKGYSPRTTSTARSDTC